MVEKCPARGGEFNAAGAALQKLCTHLMFEIPDLPAERGLRRVQIVSAASLRLPYFSDGDEVAKMSELHRRAYTSQAYRSDLQSLGFAKPATD